MRRVLLAGVALLGLCGAAHAARWQDSVIINGPLKGYSGDASEGYHFHPVEYVSLGGIWDSPFLFIAGTCLIIFTACVVINTLKRS
jgi:hypothetical protein